MTDTIRVSRELLEDVIGIGPMRCLKACDDIRALLSQPAEQQDIHPLIKTLHDNGELIAREATISQQAQMIDALQSELNEKRENIMRLLIELDGLKAPRHGHCNHGPEKTCGRCTAERR